MERERGKEQRNTQREEAPSRKQKIYLYFYFYLYIYIKEWICKKKKEREVGKKSFLKSGVWSETRFLALLPFEIVICICKIT